MQKPGTAPRDSTPVRRSAGKTATPSRRSRGRLFVLLAAAVFALFVPATRCAFVDYDDGVYVFENSHVLQGLGWNTLGYAFTSIDGGSWMPLTWLSHLLDITVFGPSPGGHHLTSVLLHSVASALLALALARLTGRLWPSVVVALLFAVHPLRTESVVWVAERKDVLCACFWMLGLLAYERHARKPSNRSMLPVAGCLLAALMSKPMAVTFPFTLLLLDVWPLARWRQGNVGRLIREKWPLFALVAAVIGLTLWSQHASGAVVKSRSLSLAALATALGNYGFYLGKCFWPAGRTVVYPDPAYSAGGLLLTAAVLAGVTGLAVWRRKDSPWLLVGWLWFLGTLVPVIGIVRVGYTPVAERYTYLPSIGLALALVWTVAEQARNRPAAAWWSRATAVAAVALLATATHLDIARWRDSGTLFAAAVRVAPHKIAYNNLAHFSIRQGDYARAVEACSQAIALDPAYASSYGNRALAHAYLKDYESAKRDYDEAIRLGARPLQPFRLDADHTPVPADADLEATWFLFAARLGLTPASAASYQARALSRFKAGDYPGARADYDQAIALSPDNPLLLTGRGNACVALSDWPNALRDLSRAVELGPTNPQAYQNRAVVYYRLGQFREAWADVNECRRLGGSPHPDFIAALTSAETNQAVRVSPPQ